MRIVAGLWLLQIITAGLAVLVLSEGTVTVPRAALATGLALLAGLMMAVWLAGHARDRRRLGEAERKEQEASKSAKLAEELARSRAEHAERLARVADRAARAGSGRSKAALIAGGALGIAGTFLLTQFLTLGLVVVAFAGGGMVGYAVRGRVSRIGGRTAPEPDAAPKVVSGTATEVAPERRLQG